MQIFSNQMHFKDERVLLGFNYTAPELNSTEHTHEFDELVIVDKGCGLHVFNGDIQFIQEGDVFMVKEGDRHFYNELGTLALMSVYINTQYKFLFIQPPHYLLNKIYAGNRNSSFWLMPKEKELCIERVKELSKINQYEDPERLQLQSEVLILDLMSKVMMSSEYIQKNNTHYKVRNLLNYLQEHYTEDTDWQWISDKFFITYKTMTQRIKELTGMTPVGYLNRLRVLAARDKVYHSDYSITEISGLCGFNNSDYFSKCYKKHFGVSPSDERRLTL